MHSQNKLKSKEYDQLMNFIKADNIFVIRKYEYSYLNGFQLYGSDYVF